MSNTENLKQYLVGSDEKEGYLNSSISNGKVIMLSGIWGSGKTHFWQNKISQEVDNDIYISLYGKKTIEDIEFEVLNNFFDDKVNKTIEYSKSLVSIFSPKALSSVNSFEQKLKKDLSKKNIEEGRVICFDDFERKSKNIDLNDLFGFINQNQGFIQSLHFKNTFFNEQDFVDVNKNDINIYRNISDFIETGIIKRLEK